jgi:hypothetical protein
MKQSLGSDFYQSNAQEILLESYENAKLVKYILVI